MGWGAAIALVALVVLGAFGIAWRPGSSAATCSSPPPSWCAAACCALFIVFPVLKALAGAFLGEDGRVGIAALLERIANERNFGLACLAADVRCGVAWNTLFLGMLRRPAPRCSGR